MKKKVIITGVDGLLGGKITKRILNHTDLSILGLTMGLDRPKDMMVREGIEASDRLCFMVNEEFLDPGTFKGFVIDRHTDVFGNIRAEPFGERASGVASRFGKEFPVEQFTAFAFDQMQGVLERDLIIWRGVIVHGDSWLKGFKVIN